MRVGEHVKLTIETKDYKACVAGVVTGMERLRAPGQAVCMTEILDFGDSDLEYLQILYDRVPSLPQRLTHDYSTLEHLWRNIAFRIARTVR